MRGSADSRIGPNFERGCRDPRIGSILKRESFNLRTAKTVWIFKGSRDLRTAVSDFLKDLLLEDLRDPRTTESVCIFKGGCRKGDSHNDEKKSLVLSWTDSGQVRLQSERVVRNRENRHKIHIKIPILPSSGRIWPNPICVCPYLTNKYGLILMVVFQLYSTSVALILNRS